MSFMDRWLPTTKEADVVPEIPVRMPATMEPREYQVRAAEWLLAGKRRILADDAGLGKTLEAAMAAVKPVLVVCPTYLVWQWAEFLEEQFPGDTIAVAGVGSRKARHKALTGSDNLATLVGKAPADWTICNVDMMRSYMMPEVETVILDEAHHFRNREAERSVNCALLCERTPRVYQLTATPIYKDVGNLYHLLHMLDPVEYNSWWEFIDRVAVTYGDRFATKIVRLRNPKALERELERWLLRRTYKDVGLFLPEVIDFHHVIEMPPATKKIYSDLRDYYRKPDGEYAESAASILHLLRHVTVGPKLEEIPNILDDNPGPCTVFTWYRETADIVAAELKAMFKRPGDPMVVKGDVDAELRGPLAKEAISKGGIVVATMASLGEGVDLSASKNCIFIEEDYVPGRMYQVLRRIVRWTEDESPVRAHYIRCRGTVDTVVHRAVVDRKGTAEQILRDALD
jgi:superfamily II DNA or RNA helicase